MHEEYSDYQGAVLKENKDRRVRGLLPQNYGRSIQIRLRVRKQKRR